MNISTQLISMCLILALISSKLLAQSYAWQYRSSTDAIQSVRTFESDPTRVVTIDFAPTSDMSNFDPNDVYSLTSGQYNYLIGAYTPEFFMRIDPSFMQNPSAFYGTFYDQNVLSQQSMSQNAALSIARAFMQQHYPQPNILNGLVIQVENDEKFDPSLHITPNPNPIFTRAYTFSFYQDCGNGVEAPDYCKVEVDTIKGEIVNYTSAHFPILISKIPTLSANQAMSSAINILIKSNGSVGLVSSLYVSKPDVLGQERLLYALNFSGIGPTVEDPSIYYNYPTTYSATVDANDGSICSWDVLEGIPSRTNMLHHFSKKMTDQVQNNLKSKRLWFEINNYEAKLSYPPIELNNRAYMYAGYLSYGSPNIKLRYMKNGKFSVTGTGRNITFKLNSLVYDFNGNSMHMTTEPLLYRSKCYVPIDILRTIFIGKWSYDSKAQTVHFDPPQKKVARS